MKRIKVWTVSISFVLGALLIGIGVADMIFKSFIYGGIEAFFGLGMYAFSHNLAATIDKEERPKDEDIQIVYRMKW